MEQVVVTIMNPLGLHARPASLLTNIVKNFKSTVYFTKNSDETKKYQPKSIFSVLSVGAIKGDQLTFVASGADEKEALLAVAEFIENGCGE